MDIQRVFKNSHSKVFAKMPKKVFLLPKSMIMLFKSFLEASFLTSKLKDSSIPRKVTFNAWSKTC